MRQGFRRVAVPPQARSVAATKTFPSPVRGWVTNMNLSAASPGAALVLDNWIPTQTGIKARGGLLEFADIGADPVTSLFVYRISGVSKLFAADEGSIWNITSTPSEDVTGQTGGYYSTFQFETTGGNYLFALNGTDSIRRYDGSSWLAITGVSADAITGVTTSTLSHGWVWKNRAFFVQGGTMNAWYLPVDSIAGAASDHTLAGVFQNGGSLLFGATWSIDAGDGADDKCVFVSSEGEVAIYEGTDPAAVATFALVGRYLLGGKPLGKNAWMRAGGDLIIATLDGMVPLSQALNKDPAALSLAAVSRNIEPDWRTEAVARQSLPWDVEKWDDENLAIIGLPVVSATSTPARCFVVNMETGAWARFTGWDTRSLAVHSGLLYFGTSDGKIMQANTGGSDDGTLYVCQMALHFDHFKAMGQYKTLKQARATFRGSKPFTPKLSASTDYAQSFPSPPSSIADFTVDEWDSAIWDEAEWDATTSESVTSTRWVSITGAGFTHALQVQISFGITPTPDVELMSYDITFEQGAVVI